MPLFQSEVRAIDSRYLVTKLKNIEQAHIQLQFMPEKRLTIGSSEFWLEPAKNFVNEKVTERRGDVTQRLLLREKRPGESETLNHWKYLV
jgi:hypothetical protein